MEKQATPFTLACAGAFDLLCGALAAAYVSQARRRVVFCPTFFSSSAIWKTYALFHELVHAHASVDDRGYGSERVFLHLPPDAAINNADSYALFTMDALAIEKGTESVRHVRRPEEDEFSDCSPANTRTLQSDFAFATRMITNARNIIGDPTLAVDLLDKHFKTHDPQELQRIVERLKKIDEKFGKMNFECESSCDPNIVGYYRTWGWTVHVCPPYFAMASAEGRQDELLLLAIREELGLPKYLRPTDAAYARQSKDDAHGNPAAYAAYARDVSKRFFP